MEKRANFTQVLLFIAMGVIAVSSIIRSVGNLLDEMGFFWAVIFGIIAGAVRAILRIAAACGMGVIWWPSLYRGTLIFEEAYSLDGAYIMCTIIIVLLAITLIQSKKSNFKLYRVIDDINGFADMFVYVAMAICVIFSGIKDLWINWDVWWIFEVPCGLVYGVFRAIMLCIGGGLWWPSLYAGTGVSGPTLTVCLIAYIILSVVLRKKNVLEPF